MRPPNILLRALLPFNLRPHSGGSVLLLSVVEMLNKPFVAGNVDQYFRFDVVRVICLYLVREAARWLNDDGFNFGDIPNIRSAQSPVQISRETRCFLITRVRGCPRKAITRGAFNAYSSLVS